MALCFVIHPAKSVISLSTANTAQHAETSHSGHHGSKLFPYQEEGVDRLVSRKRLLLADQMGLGKTIQCIEAINRIGIPGTSIILIVCPKSVMGVWKRELEVWLDPRLKSSWGEIQVASMKSKPELRPGSITLINYDICHKLKGTIQKPHYHVLICDEAHYLKTPDTKRTKAILGGGRTKGIQSDFLWLLTGTPVLNRPIELYPLLHAIAPEEFPAMQDFAGRYCDPKEKIVYKGSHPVVIKDYSGSSNLKELSQRLEPIMLRRYKMDVLSQLPEKFRSCTCLTQDVDIDIAQQERDLLFAALQELKEENNKDDKETGLELDDFGSNAENLVSYINKHPNNQAVLAKISTVRQETAFLKLKPAIELLEEYIIHEKVVVFAHHRAVIDELTQHFGDRAVAIKGGMKREDRDEAVSLFQDDQYVRLFVGSIRAAGVGLTLTAASHVIFLELDWSPGIMTQAEDRCHRVGQSNNVRIQYLVFKDSIDEWLSKSMMFKQSNIDEILPEKLQSDGTTTGYVFDFGKYGTLFHIHLLIGCSLPVS